MAQFQSIALINAIESKTGQNQSLRIDSAKDWFSQTQNWEKYYQKLNKEIIKADNFFAFNMLKLNELKVRFELIVFTSTIRLENKIQNPTTLDETDNTDTINTILENLTKIEQNYKKLYHVENLIATLSTKYEVLLFLNKKDEANEISQEIHELIDFHSLKEQKRKFEFLLNFRLARCQTKVYKFRSLLMLSLQRQSPYNQGFLLCL